jgi:hypothetical protein
VIELPLKRKSGSSLRLKRIMRFRLSHAVILFFSRGKALRFTGSPETCIRRSHGERADEAGCRLLLGTGANGHCGKGGKDNNYHSHEKHQSAEQLRQEAIKTLLDERQAIDQTLATLGYDETQTAPQKRRGRPA